MGTWKRGSRVENPAEVLREGGVRVLDLPAFYELHADLLGSGSAEPGPLDGRADVPSPVMLTDDDRVLVAASGKALAARWEHAKFDYEFPRALVAGMRAGELVAWSTFMEGEHEVIARRAERLEAEEILANLPSGWDPLPPVVLEFGEGDALWLLPYSQYTAACAHERGRPRAIDGLASSVALPPGIYEVHVLDGNVRVAPDGRELGKQFVVLLVPGAARCTNDVDDVLGG